MAKKTETKAATVKKVKATKKNAAVAAPAPEPKSIQQIYSEFKDQLKALTGNEFHPRLGYIRYHDCYVCFGKRERVRIMTNETEWAIVYAEGNELEYTPHEKAVNFYVESPKDLADALQAIAESVGAKDDWTLFGAMVPTAYDEVKLEDIVFDEDKTKNDDLLAKVKDLNAKERRALMLILMGLLKSLKD